MSLHQSILDGLAAAPGLLKSFVDAIDDHTCHQRRRDGFWTIAEHVDHLAHVQPILMERIERFIHEERPAFTPYMPDADADAWPPSRINVAESWERFARERQKMIERVARVDPAVWKREGDHPEYTAYGFGILLRHIMLHDQWHMYRIEELWLTQDAYLEG